MTVFPFIKFWKGTYQARRYLPGLLSTLRNWRSRPCGLAAVECGSLPAPASFLSWGPRSQPRLQFGVVLGVDLRSWIILNLLKYRELPCYRLECVKSSLCLVTKVAVGWPVRVSNLNSTNRTLARLGVWLPQGRPSRITLPWRLTVNFLSKILCSFYPFSLFHHLLR